MRPLPVLTLTASIFILVSCKKEKINTEEVRLTAVESSSTSSSDINHTIIDYNSDGKITTVRWYANNNAPSTLFNISYRGNEIVLARPEQNSGSVITDTTRLVLDNMNRVQKRINYTFFEFNDVVNNLFQRTFTNDTTYYEYDAKGLLKKATRGYRDSTWYRDNFGRIEIILGQRTGTDTYTNENGNVTAIVGSSDFTNTTRQSGNTSTFKSTTISTTMFQYTKLYANKTDFSNAAVLNELNLFMNLPLNRNYINLPDRITVTFEEKSNGTVISANNNDLTYALGYNSYGFLKTFKLVAPNSTTNFVYNK